MINTIAALKALAFEKSNIGNFIYLCSYKTQPDYFSKYQIQNNYFYNTEFKTFCKISIGYFSSQFNVINWEIDWNLEKAVKDQNVERVLQEVTVPLIEVVRVMLRKKMVVSDYAEPFDVILETTNIVLWIQDKIKENNSNG